MLVNLQLVIGDWLLVIGEWGGSKTFSGECYDGLGNDCYPRGQGEGPKEQSNTQKKGRVIFKPKDFN